MARSQKQKNKFRVCAKKAPRGKGSGKRRRAFMSKCLKKK